MIRLKETHRWPRYKLEENSEQNIALRSSSRPVRAISGKYQKNTLLIPLDEFKTRLSKHKSDMLCALGEAEEYNELCTKHPELCDEAQILYNEARERCAKLLGKVKAIEHFMAQHSGT